MGKEKVMREKFSVGKLLAIVLCLELASMSISAIYYSEEWLTWIYRGVTVAVYCFWFLLGIHNRSYRVTAYFKVASLFLVLAGWLMSANYIIYVFYEYFGLPAEDMMLVRTALYRMRVAATLAAMILEYLSHGKAAPVVKKGWIVLLIIQLVWLAVGYIVNQITAAQFDAQLMSAETLYAISGGVKVINLIVRMFYLWLLYRTFKAVTAKEAEQKTAEISEISTKNIDNL